MITFLFSYGNEILFWTSYKFKEKNIYNPFENHIFSLSEHSITDSGYFYTIFKLFLVLF